MTTISKNDSLPLDETLKRLDNLFNLKKKQITVDLKLKEIHNRYKQKRR